MKNFIAPAIFYGAVTRGPVFVLIASCAQPAGQKVQVTWNVSHDARFETYEK